MPVRTIDLGEMEDEPTGDGRPNLNRQDPDPNAGLYDQGKVRVVEELIDNLTANLDNNQLSTVNKVNSLLKLQVPMLKQAMTEAYASINVDPERTLAISRASSLIKEISNIVKMADELTKESTLNPRSPVVKEAFALMVEDFQKALEDANLDLEAQQRVMVALTDRLVGWEERVEDLNSLSKRIKGDLNERTPNAKKWVEERGSKDQPVTH